MAGLAIEQLLLIVAFLTLVWLMGRLFKVIRLPSILGELLAGIALGPQCFDLVPFASSGTCRKIYERMLAEDANETMGSHGSGDDCFNVLTWQGEHTVDIWSFAGQIGVTLLIMESGMHINFAKVALVGGKALIVAILGTALPLIAAMFLTTWVSDGPLYPDGFAAGCALAPTSVGISIKLLDESKMLNSLSGQTTLTAAFVDDIFSLVLLVLLNALSEGAADPVDITLRAVGAFLFLGLAVVLAKYVYIHLPKLLDRMPPSKGASLQPRDEVQLFTMLASLTFFSWVGAFIGSHLLGAFVAGICFTKVPRSHVIWTGQLKRIVRWLTRIFFAASVGFAIPVRAMTPPQAILGGLAFGALPGILCKVVAGVPARLKYHTMHERQLAARASSATFGGTVQPFQYLVGCAMVARGEFAFLVASQAYSMNMLSQDPYAMVTWGLVWALIMAPFLFKWSLAMYARSSPVVRGQDIGGMESAGQDFKVRVVGHHHVGMLREVIDALHAAGLDVIQATADIKDGDTTSDDHTDSDQFVVRSRGTQKDFDADKLTEIKHQLEELLGTGDASVTFEPTTRVTNLEPRRSRGPLGFNSAGALFTSTGWAAGATTTTSGSKKKLRRASAGDITTKVRKSSSLTDDEESKATFPPRPMTDLFTNA